MRQQLKIAYRIARACEGIQEVSGSGNNPKIINFHKATTYKATSDSVAWCSSFMGWCIIVAGFVVNPGKMYQLLTDSSIGLYDINHFIAVAREMSAKLGINNDEEIVQLVVKDTEIIPPTFNAMARSWALWGSPGDGEEGQIDVYERGSDGVSGHVAFRVKKKTLTNRNFGGNQGNAVKEDDYYRYKLIATRTF